MPASAEVKKVDIKITASAEEAVAQVKRLNGEMERLNASKDRSASKSGKAGKRGADAANKEAKAVKDTAKSYSLLRERLKSASAGFKTLMASVGRIAMYRLLRTAIKELTQAFREGRDNLYQWSKINDGVFARSMDKLASSTLYLKNVLGTAIAPIIQNVIEPAIYRLADLIAAVVNMINQFKAAAMGQSTYTRAVRGMKEYATATGGAAKELRRLLLGFDEINRLDDNRGGGGGASADYGGMFENAPVGEAFKQGFLGDLAITFGNVFFNWDNLDGYDIAQKAITGIGGLVGAGLGFVIGGTPGAIIGSLVGIALGLTFATLQDAKNGTGGVDKQTLFEKLRPALVGIFGVGAAIVVGALAASGPGALVGLTIGATIGIKMLFERFVQGTKGLSKEELYNKMSFALGAILGAGAIGGLIGLALGNAPGALIGMTIGVAISLLISSVNFLDPDGKIEKANNIAKEISGTNAEAIDLNTLNASSTRKGGGRGLVGFGAAYASGGYPSVGSYFLAGEAGAEFVGNINGRTGVVNSDQMADAVASGNAPVVSAIGQAVAILTESMRGLPAPVVNIGDKQVYRAAERGKRVAGSNYVSVV